MRIAVLGAGAMGALFGSYLSRRHTVTLVDINQPLVEKIRSQGVLVIEPDHTRKRFYPQAVCDTSQMEPVDLVIVFVKAMYTRSSLRTNRGLIGPDTYIMTLQNGGGHEEILREFVDDAHVIIGTTQHNCTVVSQGQINHGGAGQIHIGSHTGSAAALEPIAAAFTECGLATDCSTQVQSLIWDKLFTNVSASVLTGILQVPLGYISQNPDAWTLCQTLIREAVAVANADGMDFDPAKKIEEVRAVCDKSPNGYTSIWADLKNGRKSEVDTISGYVVRASHRNGTAAPTHEMMVHLVHSMEARA